MEVRLNSISGINDVIVAMYISKRTLTKEIGDEIRYTCYQFLHHFLFKVNLTEYAHIYKLRGDKGGAHK